MAHNGQTERARRLMDQAVRLGNDLGLLAEQVDPQTGDFLGNIPQGLSHLALINAAHALRQVNEGAGGLG
jgi:GH15 family glucan-1,4-alpha-glucosidase